MAELNQQFTIPVLCPVDGCDEIIECVINVRATAATHTPGSNQVTLLAEIDMETATAKGIANTMLHVRGAHTDMEPHRG